MIIDKKAILAFGEIRDYIYTHGITSMPKEAKQKVYEIVEILKLKTKEE